MHDMVFDLQLPALSWLLGKGTLSKHSVESSQAWLANCLGLPALPTAALRAQAIGLPTHDRWLCLDPIHLRVERTQLIVQDPLDLALTAAEAEALYRDIQPLMAELGTLHIAAPHAWLLQLHAPSDIRTTALPDAIGLVGDTLMPQAENVRVWRRLLTEVQMTLHNHPINAQRSARGQATINSVWPWGEGQLLSATTARWQNIQANGLLWEGLAQQLQAQHAPAPSGFALPNSTTFVALDDLTAPTQSRDAVRWRDALQSLERTWFAPIQAQLQSGALQAFTLHGHGAGQHLALHVQRRDKLRFWRKPATLDLLGAANA